MLFGGPFTFLAGLLGLGIAAIGSSGNNIGSTHQQMTLYYQQNKIIPSPNYTHCFGFEFRDFMNGREAESVCPPQYYGGWDTKLVIHDLMEDMKSGLTNPEVINFSHAYTAFWGMVFNRIVSNWGYTYAPEQPYIKEHEKFFTDPKYRIPEYEKYKNGQNDPYEHKVDIIDDEYRAWCNECEKFIGINRPQTKADWMVAHNYSSTLLKLPKQKIKIKFLE